MSDETCPQQEVPRKWLVGRLVGHEVQALLEHLEDCPACQTKLQDVTDFGDTSIDCVCQPWGQDDYQDEPQFQEAVTRAKAIRQTLPSRSPTGATSEANTDIIGQFDEYRILEKLGVGAMGSLLEDGVPTGARRISPQTLPRSIRRGLLRARRSSFAAARRGTPRAPFGIPARPVAGLSLPKFGFPTGCSLERLSDRAEIVAGTLRVPSAVAGTLRVPSAVDGTRSVPTTLELNNLFLRGR